MILNKSLRLWPTAPAFSLYAKEDTVIGGKYPIKKGEDRISVLIPQLHRDKDAWGDNVEEFQPERFEEPDKIPHHVISHLEMVNERVSVCSLHFMKPLS